MLTISQYDHLIQQQYETTERQTNDVRKAIRLDFHFFTGYLIRRVIKKLDSFLPTQLIHAKGLYAAFQSRETELKGTDLRANIEHIEKLIRLNIMLKDLFSKLAKDSEISQKASNWESLLDETIDSLYDTVRLLKRNTHKTTKESSELAVESSKRSLSSLETTS